MSESKRILMIETSATGKCSNCGAITVVRPYGPNGGAVCFQCMKKDELAAVTRFSNLLTQYDEVHWQWHGVTFQIKTRKRNK